MKKIVVIISIIALPTLVNAQIHMPRSFNIELAAGINDVPAFTPMFGFNYVWNSWFNTGLRYSFTNTEIDNCDITEHNVELIVGLTPYSYGDTWFINGNVGVIGKTQKIGNIPTPSFEPKAFNFGLVGEGEVEYVIKTYFSIFGRAGCRYLFLDDKARIEGVYTAGIRVNSRMFTAVSKIRYKHR